MATVTQVRHPHRAEWVLSPHPQEQNLKDPREGILETGKAGGTLSLSGRAETEAHGPGGLNPKHLFLGVLEVGRPRSGASKLGVW